MKRLLVSFCILISILIAAEEPQITDFLGQTYVQVIKNYGFPNSIFPLRQNNPKEDDIVFNYENSFFYFYNNKLYRIFYSSEYQGKIYKDLKIGSKKSKLTAYFGKKYKLEEDGYLWRLKDYIIVAKLDDKNKLKSIWFIYEVDK